MKNKKETSPTTEKERENFWLEIGPASAYYLSLIHISEPTRP